MATARFTWETDTLRPDAAAARSRLEAWGIKRRHEREAGVGSLPSQSGGGGRGSPSDMPGILLAACDVDTALTRWGGHRATVRLLSFIYEDGIERGPKKIHYLLPDGGQLRLAPDAEPPVRFLQALPIGERTIYVYDLDRFHDKELDRLIEGYMRRSSFAFARARRVMLEHIRSEFAGYLVSSCGLAQRKEA